jgi:hypothetical protein
MKYIFLFLLLSSLITSFASAHDDEGDEVFAPCAPDLLARHMACEFNEKHANEENPDRQSELRQNLIQSLNGMFDDSPSYVIADLLSKAYDLDGNNGAAQIWRTQSTELTPDYLAPDNPNVSILLAVVRDNIANEEPNPLELITLARSLGITER